MIDLIITIIVSYLLGSIPTAYLIVKSKSQINITRNGSGNIGAFNSFKVTKSYSVGIIVFLIDFAKGFVAVYLSKILFGESFEIAAVAALSAVVGHCFSVWINFKGGRGLATAAGAGLQIIPLLLIVWIVLWFIGYLYKKNVHFSNITATFLSLLLVLFNAPLLNKYNLIENENTVLFGTLISLILFTILVKHYGPLKEYLKFEKDKIKRNNDETV